MPNPIWDVRLPQYLLVNGFELDGEDTVIRTAMDAGPAKQRQRFTAAPTPIKGRQLLQQNQLLGLDEVGVLRQFVRRDLKGRALAFDWHTLILVEDPDYVTDPDAVLDTDAPTLVFGPATLRFVTSYKISALGGGVFDATYDLEIMP